MPLPAPHLLFTLPYHMLNKLINVPVPNHYLLKPKKVMALNTPSLPPTKEVLIIMLMFC